MTYDSERFGNAERLLSVAKSHMSNARTLIDDLAELDDQRADMQQALNSTLDELVRLGIYITDDDMAELYPDPEDRP